MAGIVMFAPVAPRTRRGTFVTSFVGLTGVIVLRTALILVTEWPLQLVGLVLRRNDKAT